MKLTYFAHRIEMLPPICNEEVHRQANYATFYVFTCLKVGGPSIAAAHEGQKVGGPRPARPNSFRRLCHLGSNICNHLFCKTPHSFLIPLPLPVCHDLRAMSEDSLTAAENEMVPLVRDASTLPLDISSDNALTILFAVSLASIPA